MPLSNQQAEKAYKKLQGLALTGSNRFTFNESYSAPIAVNPLQIWLEESLIPVNAPTTLTNGSIEGVVQKFIDLSLNAVAGTTNSFQHPNLVDCISPTFGSGYNLVMTDNLGNAISVGQKDWELDREAGIIHFFGDNGNNTTPSNMPPKVTFYKYVGAKGNSVVNLTGGGAANGYTFSTSSITNYTGSAMYVLKVDNGNTGTSTITINSLGAKNIKKNVSGTLSDLNSGDLQSNINYLLTFDKIADCFQIISGGGGAGGGGGVTTVNIATNGWTTSGTEYKYSYDYGTNGLSNITMVESYEMISAGVYKKVSVDIEINTNTKIITITSNKNADLQLKII